MAEKLVSGSAVGRGDAGLLAFYRWICPPGRCDGFALRERRLKSLDKMGPARMPTEIAYRSERRWILVRYPMENRRWQCLIAWVRFEADVR